MLLGRVQHQAMGRTPSPCGSQTELWQDKHRRRQPACQHGLLRLAANSDLGMQHGFALHHVQKFK